MNSAVRIDKWLWAVRLYRTRTIAAEACKAGHVLVDGERVKPAREVRVGAIIQARTGEITRTYRVIGLIDKRVGASAVPAHAEDLTTAEEYARPRSPNYSRGIVRPKGAGRPTKRDRRALDAITENPQKD